MPLAVSCPECGYQFRVPDSVEGQRGKCPKCKAMFVATRATETAAPAKTVSAAPTSTDTLGPSDATELKPAKGRSSVIPKPRLLEKLTPPAAPETPAESKLKRAAPLAESEEKLQEARIAPEPPPAPPRAPSASAPPKAAPAKVTPAAPVLPFDALASSPREAGAASTLAHRRAKKSSLPLLLVIAALVLVLVAGAGAGVGWMMMQRESHVADRNSAGDTTSPNAETSTTIGIKPPPTESSGDNPFRTIDEQLENWDALRAAIVTINVLSDREGTRSGTGLLVGERLVAADFQLVREIDLAVVTLGDGRRYEATGVLLRPRHSLALIKLDGDDALPRLSLAKASAAPGAVVFIADKDAALATEIARRVKVVEIPARLRPQLPAGMRENNELQLIEHLGRTTKTFDGRTIETPGGAPVLNGQGEVVGVNLALGGDTRKGYAVPVESLAELIAASQREDFRSLRRGDIASVDPRPPETEPEAENPFDPPEIGETVPEPAFEKLQQLQGLLAERKWKPSSADDYQGFAAFAHSATELTTLVDELEPAQQEGARAKLMASIEALADAPWPSAAELTSINKLAATTLPSGDTPGVFAYGRCIMRPEDFGDASIDGLPIFAFELPGTEALLVLPIGENGADIAVGSEWLILGKKDLEQNVRLNTPAVPDKEREATIVRAKYILGKPRGM
jgi:S1-C subfamily serine protease